MQYPCRGGLFRGTLEWGQAALHSLRSAQTWVPQGERLCPTDTGEQSGFPRSQWHREQLHFPTWAKARSCLLPAWRLRVSQQDGLTLKA